MLQEDRCAPAPCRGDAASHVEDARSRRRLVAAAVLGMLAAPATAVAAADAPAAPVSQAQAEETRDFRIPSQSLPAALRAFAEQSGLQLAYTTEDLAGARSAAVSGSMAPREALRRLLAGTGVTWRFTGARTVMLEKPEAGAALTLDPITVEGEDEDAWGPVEGYVARRSASATKTDTPLIETPQSVSVVTREQVEAQKPKTVNEALQYTPGVFTDTRGVASRYDGVQMRGFGRYVGTDQSTYLDGLRLLRNNWYSYTSVDPYTLERVEVFRGPGSVLYGQSSPGGLTSLVSKRPVAEPVNEVSIDAGSYERHQGAFDLGGRIAESDAYLFRLVGLARDSESQIDHVNEQRYLLAPSFTWRPSADTELTLLASYQHDPESGFYGWAPASGTIFDNPNGKVSSSFYDGDPNFEEFDRVQAMAGYDLDHRVDDTWSVRQNVRYTRLEVDYKQVYASALQNDNRTLTRGTALSIETTDALTVDNQLETRFDTGTVGHTLLAGLDYYRLESDTRSGFGTAPSIDIFSPTYYQTITAPAISYSRDDEQDQIGLYLQDQIRFGRVTLTVGGRHDWARSFITDRLTGTTTSQHDTAFTGKAGIVYEFDNGLAPYASYSESFLPVSGTDVDGNTFDPETGTQYEAGIKYQPPGQESFVGLSVFELTRQNVTTRDPDNPGFNVQTGEIRSRGVELEARANLADGLDAIAAYTFLDAEITASNDGDRGNQPVTVPAHMASLWLDYTMPAGALDGLGLGAGIRYVGETHGDDANTFTVPAFTVVDAALRYDAGHADPRLDGLELQLNAKNLFDERYISSCSGGTARCYFGARRTILGTVKYRW